jgi:hypothetical protein
MLCSPYKTSKQQIIHQHHGVPGLLLPPGRGVRQYGSQHRQRVLRHLFPCGPEDCGPTATGRAVRDACVYHSPVSRLALSQLLYTPSWASTAPAVRPCRILRRQITWHAFPFNSEVEFYDSSLASFGFHQLDVQTVWTQLRHNDESTGCPGYDTLCHPSPSLQWCSGHHSGSQHSFNATGGTVCLPLAGPCLPDRGGRHVAPPWLRGSKWTKSRQCGHGSPGCPSL